MKITPVNYVVAQVGSVGKLARALGKTKSAVSKWRAPVHRGGTGGRIPGKCHLPILALAKEHNLKITANNLIHGA